MIKSIARALVLATVVVVAACVEQARSPKDLRLGAENAQPSMFDISTGAPGTMTRWQADNGGTSVRFDGKAGDAYRLTFERDASKGQPLKMSLWAAQDGQTLRKRSGAVETRYTPHDCSLTLGRCVYREDNSRLGTRLIEWNASEENGVWSYSVHVLKAGNRTLLEDGTFTVDQRGYYIDRTYTQYRSGASNSRWSKRVE